MCIFIKKILFHSAKVMTLTCSNFLTKSFHGEPWCNFSRTFFIHIRKTIWDILGKKSFKLVCVIIIFLYWKYILRHVKALCHTSIYILLSNLTIPKIYCKQIVVNHFLNKPNYTNYEKKNTSVIKFLLHMHSIGNSVAVRQENSTTHKPMKSRNMHGYKIFLMNPIYSDEYSSMLALIRKIGKSLCFWSQLISLISSYSLVPDNKKNTRIKLLQYRFDVDSRSSLPSCW